MRDTQRLTTKSLVGIALQCPDSHQSWQAINELRLRCKPEIVALAQKLYRSRNWRKRELGLNILCQMGSGTARTGFIEYAVQQAHQLLLSGIEDSHPAIVQASVVGLGHRPLDAALPRIIALANHPQAAIRFAVAFALGSYNEPAATNALIRLCRDPDTQTRDWATFALGSLSNKDTPEIREALRRNLDDEDEQVRYEAEAGLAVRNMQIALG